LTILLAPRSLDVSDSFYDYYNLNIFQPRCHGRAAQMPQARSSDFTGAREPYLQSFDVPGP